MELQEIKGRLRELFPKANLSTTRISQYAEKLKAKLSEESTKEDVDNLIKDLNDLVDFEQVAKDDDRLRTYQKPREEVKERVLEHEQKQEVIKKTTEQESLAQLVKQMSDKIDKLESDKFQESVSSKFKSDKRLEGIPSLIVDKFVPNSFEDIDTTIESLVDTFKDEQIKAKISAFGRDIPPQGEHSKSVEVKQASDKEVDDVFKNLGL